MQTSLPAVSEPRERHLRVRLAQAEHARLVALATRNGWTVSEAVRRLLNQVDHSTLRGGNRV